MLNWWQSGCWVPVRYQFDWFAMVLIVESLGQYAHLDGFEQFRLSLLAGKRYRLLCIVANLWLEIQWEMEISNNYNFLFFQIWIQRNASKWWWKSCDWLTICNMQIRSLIDYYQATAQKWIKISDNYYFECLTNETRIEAWKKKRKQK